MTLNSKQFEDLFGKKLSKTKFLSLQETGTLLKTITEKVKPQLEKFEDAGYKVNLHESFHGNVRVQDWTYDTKASGMRKYQKIKCEPFGIIDNPVWSFTVKYESEFAEKKPDIPATSYSYNRELGFRIEAKTRAIGDEYNYLRHIENSDGEIELDNRPEIQKEVLKDLEFEGFELSFNDGIYKKSIGYGSSTMTGHHVRNVKVGFITKLELLLENVLLNITETMKETYHDGREHDIWKAEDILYKSYKLSFDDGSDVRYKKVISPIGYIFDFSQSSIRRIEIDVEDGYKKLVGFLSNDQKERLDKVLKDLKSARMEIKNDYANHSLDDKFGLARDILAREVQEK